MAIPIECEECHRQYKVDDKLAGKKVKCKGCGALIRVPGESAGDDDLRECLSCGAPLPPGNRICPKCGFNVLTGQKESLLLEADAEELKARKKRRWVRKSGSPLLESLDELVKLILILALLGGIVMTIVHICRAPTPEGFSFAAILPTLVVLIAIAGVITPVAALAVNMSVRAMKLAHREDTYVRVGLCMALPFSMAMLVGWPEMAQDWGWVASLGWPLAILLLIYLLRADVLEWAASVVAAIASLALTVIVVNLLGGAVNDIAGGMYRDMLPCWPWTKLATGHSPELPATTKTPDTAPATLAATTPAVPATASGGGAVAGTQELQPATQAATAPSATARGGTGIAATSGAPQPAPLKITSPFFAGVIDDPAIRDAAAVVVPVAPADWMLTIKNTETTTEVDRWSLNPLEKKEHLSYPYFAKKTAQFAISPKGDAVAVLSFFPRRELDVIAYDNKTPKRSIVLDLPANIPEGAAQAVPALLGILDPVRYYLRWDMNGGSALQIFSATGAGAPAWRGAPLGAASETSPAPLAPNGRTAAVFGRNQITFGNVDGTPPPKPILITNDLNVRLLGMAFSADSGQIAVYAAVAELPTVMCYQVRTGDPVFTSLLSQTPVVRDAPVLPHALVWLPGAQACLINGNDLVDAATGKKFGALGMGGVGGVAGVADVQLLGPSLIALTCKSADGKPHTVLAKLDDEKLRAAKPKP